MTLIDKLNAIDDCKIAIKTALSDKGIDMTNVAFSDYAEKIASLQLESGDSDGGSSEPSIPEPTPSVDYIYSNGYVEGGSNEILNFIPYEIKMGEGVNIFEIELISPVEIPVYTYENYDITFAVDIHPNYDIIKLEYYDELNGRYVEIEWVVNPRYPDGIVRNGETYKSYIRKMKDYMGNDAEISLAPVKYRITIEK